MTIQDELKVTKEALQTEVDRRRKIQRLLFAILDRKSDYIYAGHGESKCVFCGTFQEMSNDHCNVKTCPAYRSRDLLNKMT